jgi:hypothetical protein
LLGVFHGPFVEHVSHHLIKELVDAVLFKIGLGGLDLSSVLVGDAELLD